MKLFAGLVWKVFLVIFHVHWGDVNASICYKSSLKFSVANYGLFSGEVGRVAYIIVAKLYLLVARIFTQTKVNFTINNRNSEIFKLPSISHRRKEQQQQPQRRRQQQQLQPQQWNQQLILTSPITTHVRNTMHTKRPKGVSKTITAPRCQR